MSDLIEFIEFVNYARRYREVGLKRYLRDYSDPFTKYSVQEFHARYRFTPETVKNIHVNLYKMYCRFCKSEEERGKRDDFLPLRADFATTAIHVSQNPDKWDSHCVVQPIVTATTFVQPAPGQPGKYFYGRVGNPTRCTLEESLAALEGSKHAFAFSSGLGAMTTVYSLLSRGDHILCCDDVYGGTNRLFRHVSLRMGIDSTFADFTDPEKVENGIRPNTKIIWIETPSNPNLKVIDIAEVSSVAKKHRGVMVVVDNTFLTPYLQRPLDFGADIVVYSLTKYMNGHSDVVMGAAILNDDKIAKKLGFLQYAMGLIPSPIDCYLVLRSLKTLAVRMKQHKKNSLKIAQWLQEHQHVIKVNHPGLPEHPGHEISKRQTAGHSGCFSFVHDGGLSESKIFLTSLKLFALAESLGGYESLAELPSLMTHASITAEERQYLGITDALIRLSVGLEDADDLIKDLDQAFKLSFAAPGGHCINCKGVM